MSDANASEELSIVHRNADGKKVLAVVRASSWGDFADCELRWYFKNIEGLRLPSRGASVIGSATHRGTSLFDEAAMLAKPIPVEAAVQAAAEYVDAPVTPNGSPQEVVYDEEVTKGVAKDFAVKLTAKYCTTLAPTLKFAAVELKCNALDVETESGVIRMAGTTDRIMQNTRMEWGIGDLKSGGTAVGTDGVANTKGHGLQLGAYTLMSEQQTGKPLGAATIIGLQTNSKLRVGMGEVQNPKRALVGDDKHRGMIEIFADTAKRGVFKPNPKSNLCSDKWCPAYSRCIYHE